MENIDIDQRRKLYRQVRLMAGNPLLTEIQDEDMDILLDMAIEDVGQVLSNWLITQQWTTLQSLDLSEADISFALMTKTLDFENSFAIAYSKQVGLGTNAPSAWELKQDHITVSADTQVYVIPAGREVNEVLWHTPADLTLGNRADTGMGPGIGMVGGQFGMSFGGRPAQYMRPAFNTLLAATDASMKQKIMRSELTYRITAGPEGTKHLWLYPVPGSRMEITGPQGRHLEGSKVWYYYYDTNALGRNKCLEENQDVVRLPSDVPAGSVTWSKLNQPYQVRVRRLLLAMLKKSLGAIRGQFSGEINAGDALLKMDYNMLLSEGNDEYKAVMEEITESLNKISLRTLMEDRASIAESLSKVLAYQPFASPVMIF